MRNRIVFVLAALVCPCVAVADDADARLLKPFLSARTAAVAKFDVSDASIGEAIKSALALAPNEDHAAMAGSAIDLLRAADVKRAYLVVTPTGLQPRDWAFVVIATSAENAMKAREAFASASEMICKEKGGALFVGSAAAWERLQEQKGEDAEAILSTRLGRLKSNPISIDARFPEDHRPAFAELSPRLPHSLGGGSMQTLLEGIESLELNVTTKDRPSITAVVHAMDAAAAKLVESVVAKGLNAVATAPAGVGPGSPALRTVASGLKPTVAEKSVELTIDLSDAKAKEALKGLTDVAGENSRRQRTMNDLRQIALAMHNYHDSHKSFPPNATVDKDGKPLLSWRVHILPFLDHNELYKKFKLDEPWDSEANRKLIASMPKEYAAGRTATDGKTTILGVIGPNTLFPKPGETVRIADIRDGTSNTIMCLAAPAAQAIVWTKPDELRIDDVALLARIGVGEIVAVFCDGSSHVLPKPATANELIPYLTINGREPIRP